MERLVVAIHLLDLPDALIEPRRECARRGDQLLRFCEPLLPPRLASRAGERERRRVQVREHRSRRNPSRTWLDLAHHLDTSSSRTVDVSTYGFSIASSCAST